MTTPAAGDAGPRRGIGVDLDNCALLVRAAQRGDRDAYGELYRRFGRAVHAVLLARLPARTWTTSCRTSSCTR